MERPFPINILLNKYKLNRLWLTTKYIMNYIESRLESKSRFIQGLELLPEFTIFSIEALMFSCFEYSKFTRRVTEFERLEYFWRKCWDFDRLEGVSNRFEKDSSVWYYPDGKEIDYTFIKMYAWGNYNHPLTPSEHKKMMENKAMCDEYNKKNPITEDDGLPF